MKIKEKLIKGYVILSNIYIYITFMTVMILYTGLNAGSAIISTIYTVASAISSNFVIMFIVIFSVILCEINNDEKLTNLLIANRIITIIIGIALFVFIE